MSSVLNKYKRQPKVYIDIPSELRFVPESAYEGSFKDVPVYSMSGADELMMRNPEALLNGEAIKHLIKSCIPSLKDPGSLSFIDFEYLLLSIRSATYGNEYDRVARCPSCGNEHQYSVNLSVLIDSYSNKDYNTTVNVDDLKIIVHPLSYDQWTAVQQKIFVAQRTAYQSASLAAEDKEAAEKQAYALLKEISEETITLQVKKVITPEGEESDLATIRDFLLNGDRKYFNAVKLKLEDNVATWELKPIDLECSECQHKFQTPFTMDDASFFGG